MREVIILNIIYYFYEVGVANKKQKHNTQKVLVASAEFNLSQSILLQIDSITPYTTTVFYTVHIQIT